MPADDDTAFDADAYFQAKLAQIYDVGEIGIKNFPANDAMARLSREGRDKIALTRTQIDQLVRGLDRASRDIFIMLASAQRKKSVEELLQRSSSLLESIEALGALERMIPSHEIEDEPNPEWVDVEGVEYHVFELYMALRDQKERIESIEPSPIEAMNNRADRIQFAYRKYLIAFYEFVLQREPGTSRDPITNEGGGPLVRFVLYMSKGKWPELDANKVADHVKGDIKGKSYKKLQSIFM